MNLRKLFFVIGLLSMLVVGCGGTLDVLDLSQPPIQTWIDAPLDGSTIPQDPYTFVVSASFSPDSVDEFELWINGVLQDTIPVMYESNDSLSKYVYSEYEWMPPAPGSYLLEARGLNSDGSGPLAQARFNVSDLAIIPELPADELPEENGAEENGAGETSEENGDTSSSQIMFDAAMFYYGGCDPQQVMVEYMLADPEIFNVVLFFRLAAIGGPERTDWAAVAMNDIGSDYWGRTIASSQIQDATMFKEAYLQVQIVVTRSDGSEITRTAVIPDQVVLLACGQPPPPPPATAPGTSPTPRSTRPPAVPINTPVPTFTLLPPVPN